MQSAQTEMEPWDPGTLTAVGLQNLVDSRVCFLKSSLHKRHLEDTIQVATSFAASLGLSPLPTFAEEP